MQNSAIVMDNVGALGLLDRHLARPVNSTPQRFRVPNFPDSQSAKDFVIDQILIEAERIGMPLSQTEAKMVSYSEADRAEPRMAAIKEAFERECDETDYENKLALIIRSYRERVIKEDPASFRQWHSALDMIEREDHYLHVLTGIADGHFAAGNQPVAVQPLGLLPRLILVGVLLTGIAVLVLAAVRYLHR